MPADARARRLEYLTLGWCFLEAVVGIGAGLLAGSVALLGFGLDSVVEGSSALVMLWRFQDGGGGLHREERALKLVGACFMLLAAWILFEAARSLLHHQAPEESVVGIALAAASIVVMPLLARAKRRVAGDADSRALVADSHQTDLCAYLSVLLLAGLALNAWLGWWWADPVAALVMVPIIANEGVEALRGETCECQTG
jgi:divalent metal cation (Fe/Co/Zn/Cd) transporter